MLEFLTPPSQRQDESSKDGCAQERVPLANVLGCAVIRRDGAVVSAVSVRGTNLTGLTQGERERLARATEGALGADASRPFSIIEMPRPADRSANHERVLARCDELAREKRDLEAEKRELEAAGSEGGEQGGAWSRLGQVEALLSDIRAYWLDSVPDSGDTKYERDVYVAMETRPGADAPRKAARRAADLAERLSRCGFRAEVVCDATAIAMVMRYICPNEPARAFGGDAK